MQFSRTMGGVLGVSIMGALLAATLASQGPAGGPGPDAIVDPMRRASLSAEVRESWRRPLAEGLHRAFLVGLGAAALGILFALAIPRGRAQDHAVDPAPAPPARS
jgi:hypothetical protein